MQRLRRLAKIEDRPISEIIRRATEDYLAKAPSTPLRDAASAIPVFDGGETLGKRRSSDCQSRRFRPDEPST